MNAPRSLIAALIALAAPIASFAGMELSASELYVSERFTMKIKVRAPLLPSPNEKIPPVPQSGAYVHVDAPWLDPDTPIVKLSQSKGRTARLQMEGFDTLNGKSRYGWTLNRYIARYDFFGNPVPATFPLEVVRERVNGADGWTLTMEFPAFVCDRAGEASFADTTVTIPIISGIDRFMRISVREASIKVKGASMTVKDAPQDGREGMWINAFGREFSVEAALGETVCTLGDPISLSVKVGIDTGVSRLVAPDPDGGDAFKIDRESLKTESREGSRIFTWRIRPVKAGTVEFPAMKFSYFDLESAKVQTVETPPMPIQVKAGAQAALGEVDDSEDWPIPDGIVHASSKAPDKVPLVKDPASIVVMFALPPLVWLIAWMFPRSMRRAAGVASAIRFRRALPRAVAAAKRMDRRGIDRYFDIVHSVNGGSVTSDEAEALMKDEPAEARQTVVGALRRMESGFAKGTVIAIAILWTGLGAVGGGVDFTWQRAVALAGRASAEGDFRKAAEAFESCALEAPSPQAYLNAGACRYFAGDYTLARAAYSKAEKWTGETPSTRRGLLAAAARLKNNPRAGLGLQRSMLSWWYARGVEGRIKLGAALWWAFWLILAARSLLRGFKKPSAKAVALIAAVLSAGTSSAQMKISLNNFEFGGDFGKKQSSSIKVSASLERSEVSVGEDAGLVVSLDVPRNCTMQGLKIDGLPGEDEGAAVGDIELLADASSGNPSNVVKRLAIPLRFFAPGTNDFEAKVSFMATEVVEFRTANAISRSMRSAPFSGSCGRLRVTALPLPEQGRGDDFSGAVSRNVRLKADISARSVHPGDLVTATYTLEWDGWMPTNAAIRLEGRSAGMKEYPPKEVERLPHKAVWTQVSVPETTNDTLVARASIRYFDPESRAYLTVLAEPEPLIFVSDQAASLESGSIVVAGGDTGEVMASSAVPEREFKVRFAPGDGAKILFVLRNGAPYTITEQRGAWKRVEAQQGAGWIRMDAVAQDAEGKGDK